MGKKISLHLKNKEKEKKKPKQNTEITAHNGIAFPSSVTTSFILTQLLNCHIFQLFNIDEFSLGSLHLTIEARPYLIIHMTVMVA